MKQDEQRQELFPIIQLTEGISRSKRLVKPGMLIKRWLDIPSFGLSLFKVDSPLLSTAWSEKIAAELASKIDLPTVQYELAVDEENNRGVISPDFMNIGETELEGSDLLNQIYGRGNYLYTLDESIDSIVSNNIQLPIRWNNPSEINNAVDLFVGYLLFDSWIHNIDRHDENWGVRICADGRKELLPNFDCGISFGVKVSANDIATNRINPSRYSLIAKSMLFQQQGRSIDNVSFPDLTRQLLDRYPVATKYWGGQIVAITPNEIKRLFDRIPAGWIGEPAKNFAIELLEFNRQQIASICELAVPELEYPLNLPDDSPEPPNDSPEPPNPRNPPNSPKPSTPPHSPDSTTSPDPPNSIDSSQPMATSINIENPGIVAPNLDSQHLTDLQQERQIMTDLEGFHGNAQNQVSTSAGDISKLAEQLGQALGVLGGESSAKAVKEFFKAYGRVMKALKKEKEQADLKLNDSIISKSLADRKADLKESKQRLLDETREFRRDARKHAIKVGLDYIVSLCTNVKKFLKDIWDTPGKFFRGIKNKFTSLKDFMLQETKGAVKIGQELTGNKQEQAEKFIKLLNTPAGEQAPQGLENTIIAPWGENLIIVDAENNVIANLIQPLMGSELVQLAIDKNVVAASMAPNIKPVPNSLVSQELNLHGKLIGQDAIDQLLANVQNTQLSRSTIEELDAVISAPSQVELEFVPSIEQPLISVGAEAENAVVVDNHGVVVDPFNEPEIQPQKQSVRYYEDSELLKDRNLCDGLAVVSDLHDRYASKNENSKVLSVRGEGYVGHEYDPDLEEYIEQYYEQIVDIVAGTASISENKAYFLKDKEDENKNILYFEIQPDGHIADVKANFESKYNHVGLVNALAEIATPSELSKWKIVDVSTQALVEAGKGEIVTPETQPVVITKAQLEDLSDDRFSDLKDVVYADLHKNDEYGSRLDKMKAAADKFINNGEYAALEQFETTNIQALVQKLESNIKAEEINIPEFAQHLAENPNSLPQDQEKDLKSIQIRTEKLADAKALLTLIETKYPAQQTADVLEQPKYKLIDMSLSELTVERNAEIERAIIPHNSAVTAEIRQENLDRVLADPKYAEIQSSAAETVLTTIQDNTERLEHNRAENLARIARKNTELTGVQQLVNYGEVEDPDRLAARLRDRQDRVEELVQTVDKLTQFDEYHHQELATLAQLTASIQRPNLKPAAVELPEPPQGSQLPKSPASAATVASKPILDNLQPLPQTDFVAIVVTSKLASELVTIAQLHQIGTSSDNSSLPLLKGNEGRDSLSIAHTAQANGLHSYQVVDAGKEFNFTVTPEQIVTNFNIRRNNDVSQVRNLVTAIANVVKNPEQTEIKPHPDTDIQRIETVQRLNGLLDRTVTEPNLPAKSVVTLDSERFGVRIDRANRKMIVTDKTTLASMTLGKDGVEDGGLLKKMTEVAKDKSSSLALRLARVVVEKTNAAKTAMENAAPNIMVALDERATADRATAQNMSKAVNRLGSQVDGFIGQGIRNVAAANPGMLGSIRKMKKIEQVGDATENQVKDNLQSTGEHLSDTPLSNAPVSDAPLTENRGLLTADEREQLQQEFNAVVVHKSKAQTSGQAMQPTH